MYVYIYIKGVEINLEWVWILYIGFCEVMGL